MSLQEQIRALTTECERLREENALLRAQLERLSHTPDDSSVSAGSVQCNPPDTRPSPGAPAPVGVVTAASSDADKIALFRSFFRGREDVYAKRWTAKDGRTGYSPACANEWDSRVCHKPCRLCKSAVYTPISDQAVVDHLSGKSTMGIYPLLNDETCWFLAADFDGDKWQENALSFIAVARAMQVPAYLERSRSGNGGHVWVFFDQPIQASVARDLGAAILTRAMDSLPELSFTSYDRFFPNQGTMPKGGFGNLIALPLQREPRNAGNSVFVDDNLQPYADQWAFLSQVERVSAEVAASLVEQAVAANAVTGVSLSSDGNLSADGTGADDTWSSPWKLPPSGRAADAPIAGPLPDTVNIVRANMVFIEKTDMPAALLTRLRRIAAFQNPEFYKAQRMRLSTFGEPRVICCADDYPRHAALPRGCLDQAVGLLTKCGIKVLMEDRRLLGMPVDFVFHGELSDAQLDAAQVMLASDDGVLSAPTGFGKTVLAAWMIAARRANTLVLVHRRQLMDQWRAQLAAFLGLPIEQIGQVGGGKAALSGVLDVAMIQSVNRDGVVDDIVGDYGHVVVDECHHVSAISSTLAVFTAHTRASTWCRCTTM